MSFAHLAREQGKSVVAAFDGGELTSDAGLLLLSQADACIGLSSALAGALKDKRQQSKVQHPVEQLVRARVGAIAAGYSDGNDHNRLRRDPALRLASGRGYEDGDLAGQSTLSRWENSVSNGELLRLAQALAARVVAQLPAETNTVVLEADSTVDPCHGQQEFEAFNAHYGCHCYLPLLIHLTPLKAGEEGRRWTVASLLRSGRAAGTHGFEATLGRVIREVRARFPEVVIIVRCDSGFGTNDILNFCGAQGVKYVLGLPQNPVLHRASFDLQLQACLRYSAARQRRAPLLDNRFIGDSDITDSGARVAPRNRDVWARADAPPEAEYTVYGGFVHQAQSWPRPQRVVAKVGMSHRPSDGTPELNPRFVVTNFMACDRDEGGQLWTPAAIYRFYCQRGDQENRIKELKLDLDSGRTSCSSFRANQFRLILHTAALLLINVIQERLHLMQERLPPHRRLGPHPQAGTLRLQLFKVAARIVVSCRRIFLHLPTSYLYQELWLALNHSFNSQSLTRGKLMAMS